MARKFILIEKQSIVSGYPSIETSYDPEAHLTTSHLSLCDNNLPSKSNPHRHTQQTTQIIGRRRGSAFKLKNCDSTDLLNNYRYLNKSSSIVWMFSRARGAVSCVLRLTVHPNLCHFSHVLSKIPRPLLDHSIIQLMI